MIICKILGPVTAAVKHDDYQGRAVFAVQEYNGGILHGHSFLALDCIGAGAGDIVMVNKEGGSSRIACGHSEACVHSTITALVDTIRSKE
ncbi:MAG TPA: hypothetical protein DC049_01135 [Spirochaetia bacterium]|nr:hypothetical protein [Spirochaetia bacterium]